MIRDTPVTVPEWKRQKSIQSDLYNSSPLEIGFSTFFLNRANRSGIISGGIIGGLEQFGEWKIDARFNKESLIARISKIALYRSRISLYNQDAAIFLVNISQVIPSKTLIYLDPPYYVKGRDLYENHYCHEDHVALADLVQNLRNQRWIVSYDNVPVISRLYQQSRQITYHLNYSAAERYKGSEIMIFCDGLKIPDVSNPANIQVA